MEKIVPLPGASNVTREVAQYLRLGDTGHKILEDLVAEGRFPVQRVVVDASRHKQQAHLVEALRPRHVPRRAARGRRVEYSKI